MFLGAMTRVESDLGRLIYEIKEICWNLRRIVRRLGSIRALALSAFVCRACGLDFSPLFIRSSRSARVKFLILVVDSSRLPRALTSRQYDLSDPWRIRCRREDLGWPVDCVYSGASVIRGALSRPADQPCLGFVYFLYYTFSSSQSHV